MNKMTRPHALLAMGLMVLGGAGIALADHGNQGSQTRLRTKLSGAAITGKTPDGSAEFRMDSVKNRSSLQVDAEHVNLPAGTMLDVTIQSGAVSTKIGQIKLNAMGEGELELNSQDGATVPAVQKGDIVTVSNAGTAILAGVF